MSTEIATRETEETRVQVLARQAQQLRPHLQQLGVNETRFLRIVTNELQRNRELEKCQPSSLFAAVLLSATLDLEPGAPLGLSWFIPRKVHDRHQVVWQLGYRGIVELAARSGISIQTGAVYEADHFVEHAGTNPSIEHTPVVNPQGQPIAWYAVATLADGRKLHRVLSRDDVEKRRKVGRTKFEAGKPWFDWYDQMARKTCILAMKGILPLSPAMRRAFAADEQVQAIGIGGIEPAPEGEQPLALTKGNELVDTETGEIIETKASPPGEEASEEDRSSGAKHSAPEQATGVRDDWERASAKSTPEPENPEPAPSASSRGEPGETAPASPQPSTANQRQVLVLMAQEMGWASREARLERAAMSLGLDVLASFTDLDFTQARALMTEWAPKVDSWRINRRSRLASAADTRKVDLSKLLDERGLPLAGELSARQCQSLIDELEVEQSPANQPSDGEAASAPAADLDPAALRTELEQLLGVVKAGKVARARFIDQMLRHFEAASLDALNAVQLQEAIDKLAKEST